MRVELSKNGTLALFLSPISNPSLPSQPDSPPYFVALRTALTIV